MDVAFGRLEDVPVRILTGTFVILLLVSWLARSLHRGIAIRRRIRQLSSHSIPVMQPHSFILGHLPILKALGSGLPKDAHPGYISERLIAEWKTYFPKEDTCPPVIYLDLWPFFPQPIIYVTSAEACYQLTQGNPQPRHPMFRWALTPATEGKDLISMACTSMSTHKLWRSLLNPGFSSRNLIASMPVLLEEVLIFTNMLKDAAGSDGNWGTMFTVYDKTIRLTFDVIARVALGLRLHEQTSGPGPLFQALSNVIPLVKMDTLWNRAERLLPKYRKITSVNGKIMRDALLPQIERSAQSHGDDAGTIVDLALKDLQVKSNGGKTTQLTPDLVDTIISQIKFFLFAGHNTTAQTICWTLYEVNKYDNVKEALRAEHNEVLGADPCRAADTLRSQPYKIKELRYTTAVVKETLRLHALSETFRQGTPGFHFKIDGKSFPTEGCMIQTNPVIIHLREDLWPRPKEFLPERFMVPEGHALHPAKNAWRPFEMGSMRCIGEELAMMEIVLCLVFTVRELEFDFDWVGWDKLHDRSEPPEYVNGQRGYRCGDGVGHIKDNLPCRVKERMLPA
ncbi:cytochrome P450 [Xylaria bambusicola]|uniref:cytochrome P450 n=1 Tax=Xylaria bambusicola TaxID=326684 RepID=UPI00200742D6|nr:cytochrome P450 [Xylaria bambusicola]KAI0521216.1 cytochrome P450 [Xylaria bambusicola]